MPPVRCVNEVSATRRKNRWSLLRLDFVESGKNKYIDNICPP